MSASPVTASKRASTIRQVIGPVMWGLTTTLVLSILILVGSRKLAHFDAALVGYTFSVLFATFGLTYRYAMWLQRPPTAMYWRRGWQAFFRRGWRLRNTGTWVQRVGVDVLGNRFIWRPDVPHQARPAGPVTAAFFLMLREGLEAALIVGIISAYLVKVGRSDALPKVAVGVIAAVGLSIAAGALVALTVGRLPLVVQETFEGRGRSLRGRRPDLDAVLDAPPGPRAQGRARSRRGRRTAGGPTALIRWRSWRSSARAWRPCCSCSRSARARPTASRRC